MSYSDHNPAPSQQVLDQCAQVAIGDPAFRISMIKSWCWENKLSLIWCDFLHTADVSPLFDYVATFYFASESDATFFRLKWQ